MNKTYRSTGYKEFNTFLSKVMSRSELKLAFTLLPVIGYYF